jgi:hypothetical protein
MGDGPTVVLRLAVGAAGIWLVGGSPALDGLELGERLAQLVAGDLIMVDEKFVEDGLVEQAALLLGAAPVELLRALQEGQAELDQAACRRPRAR